MKTAMRSFPQYQQGVMLLEALIAILIFSVGILAIVGLQVNSIKLAGDAKYRSDANLLANNLLGEMWLAQSSPTFTTDYSGNATCTGRPYCNWASGVAAALPTQGVSAPAVAIAQVTSPLSSSVSSTVTIDIFWSIPGEGSHRYTTNTLINN